MLLVIRVNYCIATKDLCVRLKFWKNLWSSELIFLSELCQYII